MSDKTELKHWLSYPICAQSYMYVGDTKKFVCWWSPNYFACDEYGELTGSGVPEVTVCSESQFFGIDDYEPYIDKINALEIGESLIIDDGIHMMIRVG